MSGRALIAVTSFAAAVDTSFADRLRAHGVDVRVVTGLGKTSLEAEVIEAAEGASGIVAGSETYSRGVLERLPNLRAIVRAGAGTDSIDVEAARELGIEVDSTPGVNAESVADYTLAMMLASCRRIRENDRSVREGGWRIPEQGIDLHERTVGLIGFGAIGRAVARRLVGFGCRVAAHDPAWPEGQQPPEGIVLMSFDELLEQAEVLSVHVPLLPATRDLIGAAELERLPRGAVVVNVARGGIVNEPALRVAVDAGHVSVAAVDVFTQEPVAPSNPLVGHPLILTSSHIAAFSEDGSAAMLDTAADRVLATLRT
ncbi:phosphoglycerate dehydrogenase [Gulosibacter sp. 10]|uniref:phosphoglycerate dehydrogenase n=1 Tax=Gulosibacter sp. 10 TaxID=1255570 RepID=UPI00097F0831|nr:phosphoglycerate dehydrogenase [Gulosibacter sp. 10]SJM59731.1 D-3-phosphoglycerate dehydrogenase [Gulosibacter sp. 10]